MNVDEIIEKLKLNFPQSEFNLESELPTETYILVDPIELPKICT